MCLNKITLKAPLLLLGILLYPTLNYADTTPDERENTVVHISDTNLKALKSLQSLKNLGEHQQYQAPFVQDLQNTQNVRTLFVAAQDLPIVDIQLTFNAGSSQDETLGKGLFGMSNMAAKLLTEGTEQYSAKEIASTFEGLGAQFDVSAYRDMFIVKLRVLSDPKKLDPAIDMMLHVINHSQFKASSLNLALNNTKIGQKQLKENPSRLLGIKFYRTLYGQHPYAEPTVGTNGSIQKITPELLKAFRDKLLVAQNMNIAITGNLTNVEATDISNLISQNIVQGQAAPPLPEPQDQKDFNIQYIPYNSTQAHVMMGHLAIKRNDPDRIALEVANQMFGGNGFNSILMKELRVKRGYTYGAYSTLSSTAARGLFSLSYATEQNQLMDSIRVTHQALYDFIKNPISKKQLEETKEGMLRSFPMTFSSNANINAQIAAIGFYQLPADFLTQYQKQLSEITTQQLQRAIQKNLHANRLTLVIVANQLDEKALKNMLNSNVNSGQFFKPNTPNLIIKTTIRPSK